MVKLHKQNAFYKRWEEEISGISHRGVKISIRDEACPVPGWNSNHEGKSLCYVAHDKLFSLIMRKFVAWNQIKLQVRIFFKFQSVIKSKFKGVYHVYRIRIALLSTVCTLKIANTFNLLSTYSYSRLKQTTFHSLMSTANNKSWGIYLRATGSGLLLWHFCTQVCNIFVPSNRLSNTIWFCLSRRVKWV